MNKNYIFLFLGLIAGIVIIKNIPNRAQQIEQDPVLIKLQEIEQWTTVNHPILGDAKAQNLRKRLEDSKKHKPSSAKEAYDIFKLSMNLSHAEMQLGNLDRGIELAEDAYTLLKEIKKNEDLPEHITAQILFDLGVAYMRRSETRNCCQSNAPDNCILPLKGSGLHRNNNDTKKTIQYFTDILKLNNQESELFIKAKWLVNIMHMALGSYPEGVPEKYRIPNDTFQSKQSFPRFKNIASELGLDCFDLLGGVIIDDFNGDEYLDIVVSSWDPRESMRLFINQQNGSFAEETNSSGLGKVKGGFNLVQADYDNDGDVDIYVLRGAWMGGVGKLPNSLLQNNGKGTFIDVTYMSGLGHEHYPSSSASWADYNNDGFIDLYVGNEASGENHFPCQLFHNNGDGTFKDKAKEAGVQNMSYSKGVVWGDYNNDDFADLYVSNLGSQNKLYKNNQDGSFSDVAEELKVDKPIYSFPVWFWDYNNDGVQDLYVSSYDWNRGNITAVIISQLDQAVPFELACLYEGNASGYFKNVSQEKELNDFTLPMGANFGDLDNDGFLDFYLGTGYPHYEALMPNIMYRNQSGEQFEKISYAGGFAHIQKGHGVAFADLDNDGDLDVYQQMGGFYPGDKAFNALYENPGWNRSWISIQLEGVQSNRSAIGARIHVVIEKNDIQQSIYRHINSGGSFGANPLRQNIGLGDAKSIHKIEVYWPTTQKRQSFENVAIKQFIKITESKNEYETLPLKKLSFRKLNH